MRRYLFLALAVALAMLTAYVRPWDVLPGMVSSWTSAQVAEAAAAPAAQNRAVVVLEPVGQSRVAGTILLTQQRSMVTIRGTITGLTPGQHGFHIHQYGDLTDRAEGKSAGDHYNPTAMPHGAPESRRRHVGDLGNITADAQGRAVVSMTDRGIRLNGAHSVLGRSLVVHAGADKFTQPSGDAGARVAFGVVGWANPKSK